MQGLLFTDNGRNAFIGYKEYTGGTAGTYGEALHFSVTDYSASDVNSGFWFGSSSNNLNGVTTPLMFLKANGLLGVGTTDFSYTTSDNSPSVGSFTNNRVFVNGSIQLLGNNDAIVFGRGTSSFLKDEELGFGWGGGWYMNDGTWIRSRGSKNVYVDAYVRAQGSFRVGSEYSIWAPYGTYSAYMTRMAYISFDWNASYDLYYYHGISSTDLNGSFSDSMSINSFNDIILRIDSNNNNNNSYVRFMDNTDGNNQFAYIGRESGNSIAYFDNRVYGAIFYDSNDSGYYIDPNSTSMSALRMRGGALFGPNPTWGAYLLVGGNGREGYVDSSFASVATTNGNLHLDSGNGYATYINYYDGSVIYFGNGAYTNWGEFSSGIFYAYNQMRSPIMYDYNDTGYYVDPNATKMVLVNTTMVHTLELGHLHYKSKIMIIPK